jgi:hypothetical protein
MTMNKPYRGGGKLVTRLLGRLEIMHGDGVIEFRLRSDNEIDKRKVVTVLRVEGLGDVPRIEDGTAVHVDVAKGLVSFAKEAYEVHSGRPGDRKGAA